MINISDNLKEVAWEALIDEIKNKECILFLGPGIFSVEDEEENRSQLNKFLRELYFENKEDVIAFFENDDLVLFSDDYSRKKLQTKILQHFNTDYENELMTKILEIPFHFIINLAPYSALEQIAKSRNYKFESEIFYSEKPKAKELIIDPTNSDKLLIYKLLGAADEKSSLILTHEDLFEYINAVYAENRLPEQLIQILNNKNKTQSLLFLGVDFSKWYTQLILNVLGLENAKITRMASGENMQENNFMFCRNHLKIEFITDNIKQFIIELHKQYQNRFELRSKSEQLDTAATDQEPIYKNFRLLLNKSFSGDTFSSFCMDYFIDVYDSFTNEQSFPQRIQTLLNHVRKYNLYQKLLDNINEVNPTFIEQCKPYFE